MTGSLRQQLRHALDRHARARRQTFIDAGELDTCAGCGCDLDQYTDRCNRCKDRRSKRHLRNAPEFRQLEAMYSRNYRARRDSRKVTA